MWSWDGSDIGTYSVDVVQVRLGNIWRLALPEVAWAEVTIFHNNLPCIIDELKRPFGITRNGTHTITIGSKKYLLTQVDVISEEPFIVITPLPLAKVSEIMRQKLRETIQRTWAYRLLAGISSPRENLLVLARFDEIRSTHETSIRPSDFPKVILNKWFQDVDLSETIYLMITRPGEELEQSFGRIRHELENIVNRIDSSYGWVVTGIMQRVIDHCLRATSKISEPKWKASDIDLKIETLL